MKITKILNNNAVVIMEDNQEKIAIGAGVGFNKRKNDIVQRDKIEKLFILRENEKLQQLLMRIPEEQIILAEEIIDYAEGHLKTTLSEHVRIGLTDHISFAIERENEGIHLKNKLLQEIKILYREEFQVGLWALKHINEKLNISMPVDEAAFIALHIHTMKLQGGDLHETVRQTTIVREMVDLVKDFLNVDIEEDDIAYERLITHLRFALIRSKNHEAHTMDEEMFHMIKEKFSESFECALMIAKHLSDKHGIDLPEEELGYVSLHIERLRKQEF